MAAGKQYKRFAGSSVNNAGYHNENWDKFFDGNALHDVGFDSLAEALTYIGTSNAKTLYLTTTHRLTASRKIPANVALVALKGCKFDLASGVTLTIQGAFDPAGNALADLFTGAGTYAFEKTVSLIGTGTPEAVVTAPVGSTFQRTNGSTATTLYVKESGTGNTGWVANGSVAGSGTLNYIPLWTPDGATLGNSLASQSGTTITVAGSLTNTALAGTGIRLVTSTAAGLLGNATTIAGAYTFSEAIILSSTLEVTGAATLSSLAGADTRLVTTSSTGLLSSTTASAYGLVSGAGSGVNTRIAYWVGTSSLSSNASFLFDGTTFSVGSTTITVSSGNTSVAGTLAVTGVSSLTGNVGIGGASNGSYRLQVFGTGLTGTAQYGTLSYPTFSSAATSSGVAFQAQLVTAASAFTMGIGIGVEVGAPSLGAGSAVTTLYGIKVADQTGGGTNYALYTGAGLVRFGGAVSMASTLAVTGVGTFSTDVSIAGRLGIKDISPNYDIDVAGAIRIQAGNAAYWGGTGAGDYGASIAWNAGDGFLSVTATEVIFSNAVSAGALSASSLVASGAVTIGNGTAIDKYEEGTFAVTLTGISGVDPTSTAYYTRLGKLVTLYIPSMSGTSDTTACTLTGLPANIRPHASRSQAVAVDGIKDNGNNYAGYLSMDSFFFPGEIHLYFRNSLTATPTNTFTSSGTKGIDSCTISYTIQ